MRSLECTFSHSPNFKTIYSFPMHMSLCQFICRRTVAFIFSFIFREFWLFDTAFLNCFQLLFLFERQKFVWCFFWFNFDASFNAWFYSTWNWFEKYDQFWSVLFCDPHCHWSIFISIFPDVPSIHLLSTHLSVFTWSVSGVTCLIVDSLNDQSDNYDNETPE